MANSWGSRMAAAARTVAESLRQPMVRSRSRAPKPGPPPTVPGQAYAGDFSGVPTIRYAPVADGHPDPGEVVWAWVPYEEDFSQGKDRPVVVVSRAGRYLLAVMCTSKDHDRDLAHELRAGRHWFDIGTGPWDREGRPSEVRLDRILQLEPTAVRREGAALDQATFEAMGEALLAVRRH